MEKWGITSTKFTAVPRNCGENIWFGAQKCKDSEGRKGVRSLAARPHGALARGIAHRTGTRPADGWSICADNARIFQTFGGVIFRIESNGFSGQAPASPPLRLRRVRRDYLAVTSASWQTRFPLHATGG